MSRVLLLKYCVSYSIFRKKSFKKYFLNDFSKKLLIRHLHQAFAFLFRRSSAMSVRVLSALYSSSKVF